MIEHEIVLPELHANQQTVKDNYARFNVLDAGRRFGKDILEIDYTVDGVLDGKPVGWGSPTYKNLTEDWRELTNILAPVTSRLSEQERRIETIIPGGVLEMWSLDNPGPIRGRSYGRWVTNEAAQVPHLLDTWNEIIRSTLIDLKGGALFGSTPKGMNDFQVLHSWGASKDDWRAWHYTSYDNPYLDTAELDALRSTMSDQQYREEIMAEFLQNDAAVIRNLEAALTSTYDDAKIHKEHVCVAGVDWGKSNDFTVISVGCKDCEREVYIDRFNQIDYHFQRQRLEAAFNAWQVKRGEIELNSIGQPNFEELVRAGLHVVGFTTTLTTKQPLIESFSLAIETGKVKLLPDDVGRSELQAYEVKRTETGISKYSAPEGMHDDTVIARALMWRAMQHAPKQHTPNDTRTAQHLQQLTRQGVL